MNYISKLFKKQSLSVASIFQLSDKPIGDCHECSHYVSDGYFYSDTPSTTLTLFKQNLNIFTYSEKAEMEILHYFV